MPWDQQSLVLLAPSGWATLCPSVCSVCPSVKLGVLGSPYSSWTHLSWCYFCLCHGCAHHYPLSPLLLLPPLRLWPLLLAPLPRLAGSRLCQGMSLQSPLPSLDSTARGNPTSMNISCAECKSENRLHICQEVMCTSPAIRQPLSECLRHPPLCVSERCPVDHQRASLGALCCTLLPCAPAQASVKSVHPFLL